MSGMPVNYTREMGAGSVILFSVLMRRSRMFGLFCFIDKHFVQFSLYLCLLLCFSMSASVACLLSVLCGLSFCSLFLYLRHNLSYLLNVVRVTDSERESRQWNERM